MSTTHSCHCFCGAVQFEVTGEPVAMGICHCESCRRWAAAPVNGFTLWQPDAVKVVQGEDKIAGFWKTPNSHRKWCTVCGGHVFSEHPSMGLTDVSMALLPDLEFRPALHVNYQECVLPIRDGIVKLKDFPKQMGGSGEVLPE